MMGADGKRIVITPAQATRFMTEPDAVLLTMRTVTAILVVLSDAKFGIDGRTRWLQLPRAELCGFSPGRLLETNRVGAPAYSLVLALALHDAAARHPTPASMS